MKRLTGGCLCSDVRLVASGAPNRVGLCHCLDCRKHHGALFFAAAMFPRDAVTIEGETRDYAGRHFCPRCGSSVFARGGDEIEVHLGALDAPTSCNPPTNAGPSAAKRGSRRSRSPPAMSATVTLAADTRTKRGAGSRKAEEAIACI